MHGDLSPHGILRCSRCGIESAEPTCFANATARVRRGGAVTCITCTQSRQGGRGLRLFFRLFGVIAVPVFLVMSMEPNAKRHIAYLVIAALLMQPLIVVLHELGHFLTARMLGLEASLIILGTGRKLWGGRILSVPLRIHGWPLGGLTFFGSTSLRGLRLRVWLTVLMGPATNMLLIAVAVVAWTPLARLLGFDGMLLWILFNGILAIGNLLPRTTMSVGRPLRTDGMQLLQIPFKNSADLAAYLSSHAIVTAWMLLDDADYVGAQDACVAALQRRPGDQFIATMLSVCQINLGDYAAARRTLEPLRETTANLSPALRAVVANNIALALWLCDTNSAVAPQAAAHAHTLSNEAYALYPCVLPYRSTQALLLAATGRADEALKLLRYPNYDLGGKADRADREAARAFALRLLDRRHEAEQALAAALRLDTTRRHWLVKLGLLTTADANEHAGYEARVQN